MLRALAAPLLAPLSALYRIGLIVDRAWRRSRAVRLSRTVISVGNLTVGGTGKTPVVIRLAADLRSMGKKPAVLARGYQGALREAGGPNDEILLVAEKLPDIPIGAGSDRRASAEMLLNNHQIDMFLLDDGFQHWPLVRDMDIVCVDATNPWGGGHLLPWGWLREPAAALARADAVLLTRTELAADTQLAELRERVRQLAPRAKIISASFSNTLVPARGGEATLSRLSGRRAVALSAIGRPQAFEEGVSRMGAERVVRARFPDHHLYEERDLARVERIARVQHAVAVTTEKDWVKLKRTRWGRPGGLPISLFVLKAELAFKGADETAWRELVQRCAAL